MSREAQQAWTRSHTLKKLTELEERLTEFSSFIGTGGKMPSRLRKKIISQIGRISNLKDELNSWAITLQEVLTDITEPAKVKKTVKSPEKAISKARNTKTPAKQKKPKKAQIKTSCITPKKKNIKTLIIGHPDPIMIGVNNKKKEK